MWVELPEEDYDEQDRVEDRVGLLNRSLYGTRDAAQNWGYEMAGSLQELGMTQGRACRCLFVNKVLGMRGALHGDDLVVTGVRQDVDRLVAGVEAACVRRDHDDCAQPGRTPSGSADAGKAGRKVPARQCRGVRTRIESAIK